MVHPPFDALLCDLDGVLRLWDPAGMPALDRAYGLAAGTLAGAAFAPGLLRAAVTGARTDEEWRAAVAAGLAEACGGAERARALVADWSALSAAVDEEVRALLTAARRHIPVVLVTNATTRLEADLAALGLTETVDAVLNTARYGVAKPDAEVYRTAADLAGTAPHRCLFVDDTEANVTAAVAAGMRGLHYRSAEDLRSALVPFSGTSILNNGRHG